MRTYEEVLEQIAGERRTWLVTGAAGFIGSNLLEKLLVLGQAVVGLDNFSTGSRDNLELVKGIVGEARWQNFHFIEGDIRDLAACRQACEGVELVLHQAALGSVPRSVADPIASHENNISGFLNLLVAARDAKVSRLVYASSSSVYGDDQQLPKVESRIGQQLSPYAVTKYVDELYAANFARTYDFPSIGLRYFNVFGPRQKPDGPYAAVIPAWIQAMLNKEPIYINGDGETARDFCYVDNAVQANLLAAMTEDPAAVNEIYNIALNSQMSLNMLFETLRALVGTHFPETLAIKAIYRDFRAGDMRFSRANIGKAHGLLGYHPVWPVQRGLKKTVEWYIAQSRAASDREQRIVAGEPVAAVPENAAL
ncbi:SDR family oxidoreductase [Dechloromonas sp. XY25]|uniref:SDR family oxidoreductase n=1 Tax=Dechloromonas hankyongensis TaxID=2908002 RepID=A0ABS9K6A5_9RHOO|nr:SDR family oxidoreductase [Dechloromonas hankyongensis]MCG2578663.1 SDR family oxidoreductase [Dechloromonas hankyongensis]